MSREAIKLALEALELINLEFVCANGSHHAKKDRHEWDEDCPITDRWRKAITALQKALANEALDKKAENARELGLDYEPAQKPVAFNWVNDDGFLRKKPTEQTAKQEPVAWIFEDRDGYATIELIDLDEQDMQNVSVKSMTPLYASPPAQRTWVGLTDEELKPLCAENHIVFGAYTVDFIRAIEANLREKNT